MDFGAGQNRGCHKLGGLWEGMVAIKSPGDRSVFTAVTIVLVIMTPLEEHIQGREALGLSTATT